MGCRPILSLNQGETFFKSLELEGPRSSRPGGSFGFSLEGL